MASSSGTTRTLNVRVVPRASRNSVEEASEACFKVHVTTTPDSGKANEHVIKLLAKYLHVPKTSLTIARGHRSRDKVIQHHEP